MKNKINSIITELKVIDIHSILDIKSTINELESELNNISYKIDKYKEQIKKKENEQLKIKINYISPIYDYLDTGDSDLDEVANLFGSCQIDSIETFNAFSKFICDTKFTYCYLKGNFSQPGKYYLFLEESTDRCGDHCYNYTIIYELNLPKNKTFNEIFLKQKEDYNKYNKKEII